MTVIKEGFDSKPLVIKVSARDYGNAEVWTEMMAKDGSGMVEQLHYATTTELIELRDEINKAIKTLAGV